MKNPIKMDDLGVPLFLETPICLAVWVALSGGKRLFWIGFSRLLSSFLVAGWLGTDSHVSLGSFFKCTQQQNPMLGSRKLRHKTSPEKIGIESIDPRMYRYWKGRSLD